MSKYWLEFSQLEKICEAHKEYLIRYSKMSDAFDHNELPTEIHECNVRLLREDIDNIVGEGAHHGWDSEEIDRVVQWLLERVVVGDLMRQRA